MGNTASASKRVRKAGVSEATATEAVQEVVVGTAADQDQTRELRYAEALLDGESTHLQAMYNHYIHNLLQNTGRTTATAYRIACELETAINSGTYGKDKKFAKTSRNAKDKAYPIEKAGKISVTEEDWKTLLAAFAPFSAPVAIPDEDITFKNLVRLTDILGLGSEEKKPLQILYVAQQYDPLSDFIGSVFGEDLKKASIGLARMVNQPLDGRKFAAALGLGARLNRYGLTYFDSMHSGSDKLSLPRIEEEVLEKFDRDLNDEQIAALLLEKTTKSTLDLADFSHVGEQLDFALTLIKKSVENGERGINLFLHGPAGSGKTELAGVIAKHLGLSLYSVGEPNEDDGMEEYTETGAKRSASDIRIRKLQRTHALLEGSKNSIVLFDEIEDLLMKGTDSSKSADVDNKLEVNRLLENNPVVTIWTGNNPEKFHEAVRQRFSFSILMDYPPTLVREKIWNRRLTLENVDLPQQDVRSLAREYEAPPRMISKAVRSVRIMGGGAATIRSSLEADSKIAFGQSDSILSPTAIAKGFDLAFVNANQNLPELFNRLVARGNDKKQFSLLVQAPPATGAEHVLRAMAEEMVMNPLEVSVAGLCAPHPMMGPEQKFASAFAGAADMRQFLILTGLEDIAIGPEGGQAFWNTGLVDLFSEHALNHKLPFAVTLKAGVKLPDHVAMLFSDKVSLSALDAEQSSALYLKTFGRAAPEEQQAALAGLTAEDFNKAFLFSKRLDLQGDDSDHARLIGLLDQFRKRRAKAEQPTVGFQNGPVAKPA